MIIPSMSADLNGKGYVLDLERCCRTKHGIISTFQRKVRSWRLNTEWEVKGKTTCLTQMCIEPELVSIIIKFAEDDCKSKLVWAQYT